MTKANGFTLIEVLFASSILLSFFIIVVPIASKIHVEQEIIIENRNISQALHEELQAFLWTSDKTLPTENLIKVGQQEVFLQFMQENEFVKGCANWNDANKQSNTFCLYGLQKK